MKKAVRSVRMKLERSFRDKKKERKKEKNGGERNEEIMENRTEQNRTDR